MLKKIGIGLAAVGTAAVATGGYLRFIRPRLLSWGATGDEIARPMVGDELCARPQFNATRAVTIRARPEEIWPWLVQIGFGRAGWYTYDLLDNLGRHSAERIIPEFQHLAVGDWVPMGLTGEVTPYTAYRVTRMEPDRLMLWEKGAARGSGCSIRSTPSTQGLSRACAAGTAGASLRSSAS